MFVALHFLEKPLQKPKLKNCPNIRKVPLKWMKTQKLLLGKFVVMEGVIKIKKCLVNNLSMKNLENFIFLV